VVVVLHWVSFAPAAGRRHCATTSEKVVYRHGDVVLVQDREASTQLDACLLGIGKRYSVGLRPADVRRGLSSRVFADGAWFAYARRRDDGRAIVEALNLRRGARHAAGATAASEASRKITALVVNRDGALAWIAVGPSDRQVTTQAGPGSSPLVLDRGSDIDAHFLSLEDDRCTIAWRRPVGQRTARIHCTGELH
jgi:hypothetical protein